MRHYKFRARLWDTGEFVYGKVVTGNEEYLLAFYDESVSCPSRIYKIQKDSVAQLVGYDANGREIYEGDTVTVDGEELDGTARISPEIIFGNGFGKIVNDATQKSITLKE